MSNCDVCLHLGAPRYTMMSPCSDHRQASPRSSAALAAQLELQLSLLLVSPRLHGVSNHRSCACERQAGTIRCRCAGHGQVMHHSSSGLCNRCGPVKWDAQEDTHNYTAASACCTTACQCACMHQPTDRPVTGSRTCHTWKVLHERRAKTVN